MTLQTEFKGKLQAQIKDELTKVTFECTIKDLIMLNKIMQDNLEYFYSSDLAKNKKEV